MKKMLREMFQDETHHMDDIIHLIPGDKMFDRDTGRFYETTVTRVGRAIDLFNDLKREADRREAATPPSGEPLPTQE